MARTSGMTKLARSLRIAKACEAQGLPTNEVIERAHASEQQRGLSRRRFLSSMAAGSALVAGSGLARAGKAAPTVDVAVVGAGLAGLSCAYELARRGVAATVYEAGPRVGGRQFSLRGFFPGQVAERGGELIDSLHMTMRGYVRDFGLTLEDFTDYPGETFYHFDGVRVPEATVVDEFRNFVAAMRADLQTLSGAPTAQTYTSADRALDYMSLAEYLDTRGAGRMVRKAIEESYVAEYGLELDQQSCLNFLLFIHADKRSKFTPFGVFSNERYHVIEGNDAIATNLAAALPRGIEFGHRLERVKKTAGGRVELSLADGNRSVTRTHDTVVLATPFTVLRNVDLDPSLGLSAEKRFAIDTLGYGTNAKTMVGFAGPFWFDLGCSGAAYSDLPNCQTVWETNPARATSTNAVLTDYSGGTRGTALRASQPQQEAAKFIADLDKVMPGAKARAIRDGSGRYLVHLEHWPSNPLTKGSYTCYTPGQFTTVAGHEGSSQDNLHFAGEHANSFYEWQGFMEGACLSGLDAAAAILAK